MKINTKIFFLGVVTCAMFSIDAWSSNVSCIKCKNNPDTYCYTRNQGPEIVECFKKCSANNSFGQQGIAACLTSMSRQQNHGLWNLASKRAFEAWYREIGGENGLETWTSENKEKVVALMRDLPANSEHDPIAPIPKGFHPMMYLALNPDLYNRVKNKSYLDAAQELIENYQMEGAQTGRAFVPDNTHKVQLVEGLKGTGGLNAMEFLAKHPDEESHYTRGMAHLNLAETLEDVETRFGTKVNANAENTQKSLRKLPEAPKSAAVQFDPLMYLALNPSLLDGVKNKPLKQAMEELTHHYQTTGKNDGKAIHPDATHRIPGFHTAARPSGIPLTFNPIEYLALHADIVAYYGSQGMTLEEALEKAEVHYGSSGIKEQRAFSLGFTDEAKIPEQKQVEQKFDPLIYLALHPDIAAHYGKLPIHQALHEVTQHYASNGKGEGRAIVPTNTHPVPPLIPGSVSMGVIAVLPKNFNAAIYLVQHRDVFDYFSNEHRFGPSKTLNELLSDATAHYADNGRHEGRGHELTVGGEGQSGSGSNSNAGPGGSSSGSGGGDKQAEAPAFDPLLYLAMNRAVVAKFKDLPIKDALEQARVHYETEGKGQNLPTRPKPGGSAGFYMSEMGPPMQFGPGFNPLIYLSLHQDLYEAFANGGHATLLDVIKAVSAHYVQNGKGEGRAIKHLAQDQPAPEKPKPVKPPVVQNDKPLHEQAQDQLEKLRGIGGDHPSQKPQGGPTCGGDDLKNNSAWQAHQKKMQGPPDDSDDDEWSD